MTGTVTDELTTENLPLVELGVADDVIAGLRLRLQNLKADTPAGYKVIRAGIAEVRDIRVGVEKSRKQLKESALKWGKTVDAEAKRVTTLLLEIENPLKLLKAEVDDEKARVKRDKEEKDRLAQEAQEREDRLRQKAIEDAERRRIQKEQEAERERLEADRAEIERDRIKALEQQRQLERDRVEFEKERDQLEEQRRLAEQAKQAELKKEEDRLRAIQEEDNKKLAIEKALATEKARLSEEARTAAERKPDAEKIREFAEALRGIEYPTMKTEWGQKIIDTCKERIGEQAGDLDIECRNFSGGRRLGS